MILLWGILGDAGGSSALANTTTAQARPCTSVAASPSPAATAQAQIPSSSAQTRSSATTAASPSHASTARPA